MLSPRQTVFYVYTVDIWRQADSPAVGADFGHYALHLAGAPCLYASAAESDAPGTLGRSPNVDPSTFDHFGFDLSVDVRDTDMLHLTAGPTGDPDIGRWFAVHGNPQRNAWRANRQRVPAKGCPAPAGAL